MLLIAAPAGYGKTTLVTQWVSAGRSGRVAWVNLDPADNDPTRLWTHLAAALECIGHPIDANSSAYVAMSATAISDRVLPRLVATLTGLDHRVTIVLEDCHVLRSAECSDQLDRLIENLPSQVHLVLVSRSDPNVRLGRLRVAGRLAEIRTSDLVFTQQETSAMFARSGVVLSEEAVAEVVQQTEGWPAASYLAALSLVGRGDPEDFIRQLSGNDRFVADYLSEEVLGRLDGELREFILTMSLFDRFNAALANEVLGSDSALRLLRTLERTNLFLIPLHGGGWFRFHHLFATFARGMMEVEHPERIKALHRRAADWFAARDHIEEMIRHLLAAADVAAAADAVQANWLRFFDAGRWATVVGWLTALRGTSADSGAAVAVTAAWMAALTGNQPEMRRRLAALEAMAEEGPLPDGTASSRSALMLIRGLFGYDGPDRMLDDACRAVELEPRDGTPWHAVATAALGCAGFVVGDVTLARERLRKAAWSPTAPRTIRVLALSYLSLSELEQGNQELASRLADQAMDIVAENSMQAMPNVLHAYTAHGASLAAENRLAAAGEALDQGLPARRHLPGLSPWPLIHHLIARADVAARSGERALATELLAEVDTIAPWADESMAATRSRIAEVRRRLTSGASQAPTVGDPLTPREGEILRRLQGTQTLREIASDLYVSHNTVKTITLSVYRKLGVHTRAEAVALVRQLDGH